MALELFRRIPDRSVAVLSPPQWPFIQRGYTKNIQKVIDYYKLYTIGVKSNHLLVRLLHSITVPKTLPLERYYAHVENIALHVAMTLQLTSVLYKGRIHRGTFYGPNLPEIIIATDDFFDPEEVHNNWRNVSAVKPLLHPKSDLGIQLPNGKHYSDEYGLSVILINVPMLAVQYRAFFLDQLKRNPEDGRKTTNQFIGGYVLPNMIKAQMEINLFNRINRRFYKIKNFNDFPLIKHPFALADYTGYIDDAIDNVLEYSDRSVKRFDNLLRTFPSFSNENLYESLLMPDIAPTRQVDWALCVARLRVLNLLIDIAGRDARTNNQITLNQAMRSLATYDTYNLFKEMLPDEIFFEVDAYVDNLLEINGRTSFR